VGNVYGGWWHTIVHLQNHSSVILYIILDDFMWISFAPLIETKGTKPLVLPFPWTVGQ